MMLAMFGLVSRHAVLLSIALGCAAFVSLVAQAPAGRPLTFICPMHPDVIGAEGDTCPRCGMRLVPMDPGAARTPAVVDFQLTPRAISAAAAATLRLAVRSGANSKLITDFEPIHERPMHLFVIGHDLEYFAHLHPAPAADGSFDLPLSVPRAGVYHAFIEFMPRGGTPQLVQKVFMTAGTRGGVPRNHPRADLVPKIDRTIRVELQLPADGLVAGRGQSFRCSVSDTAGAPVRDLQPYLGTLGHMFIVSADFVDAEHVHPIPDFSDSAGPNLVFEATFPRAGMYRLWLQVQRAGELFVAPFTVPVNPG